MPPHGQEQGGIGAQRLVRKLCPQCREPDPVAGGWRAVGCLACNKTGYAGRTGIYELLPMTTAIKEAIIKKLPAEGVRRVIVTTDDPDRYRGVTLPVGVDVWPRTRLMDAQQALAYMYGPGIGSTNLARFKLPAFDALVTDYSSLAFDAGLVPLPVVFFAPDLEAYTARRGLYGRYRDVAGDEPARTWESALAQVDGVLDDPADARDASRRLSAVVHAHHDGRNAERVHRAIRARLTPRRPAARRRRTTA